MELKEEVKVNTSKDFVLKLADSKKFFAAIAIVFKGNKVLMGKSLADDVRKGKLTFPGGHIDGDESPYAAAKRETREETGIMAKIRVLPIIEDIPNRIMAGKEGRKLAFIVLDHVGGKLEPNEEFEYLEWYPLNDMPWSEMYSQNAKVLKGLMNKEKVNIKESLLKEDSAGSTQLLRDIEATDLKGKKHLLKKGTWVKDESNYGSNHIWITQGRYFAEEEIPQDAIDIFCI